MAVGAYLLVSWYLPRRAAKRDLAGIEKRLEAIERDMAILLDRVDGRGEGGGGDAQRMDDVVNALESLTETLAKGQGE